MTESKFTPEYIALAKSEHLKLIAIWDKSARGEYKTDNDDEMEEFYTRDIVNKFLEALTEIERLQAQVENRDAMIERLITAIESGSGIRLRPRANVSAISLWWLAMNKVISELKTMKGGE